MVEAPRDTDNGPVHRFFPFPNGDLGVRVPAEVGEAEEKGLDGV